MLYYRLTKEFFKGINFLAMSSDIPQAGVGEQYPRQPFNIIRKFNIIIFINNIKRLIWVLFTYTSLMNITTPQQ
jgi:hypothetical protein